MSHDRQTETPSNTDGAAPKKTVSKKLSPGRADSEGAIGIGLRSLYQDIVKEPLPADMMALLDQLESTHTHDDD